MSKMTFEDVGIIWAAKEFKIPRHQIESVKFDIDNEISWVDTFGNETHSTFVRVIISYKDDRKNTYHKMDDMEFVSILEGLVKVASRENK